MATSKVESFPREIPPWLIPTGRWIILVCFIGDVRNRVVCVIEWESKEWKKEGQTWVVFETLEKGEVPEEALFRALDEELDLADRSIVESFEKKWNIFLVGPGHENPTIIFDVWVYLVQLKTGTTISKIVGENPELLSRGMRDIISLNGDTRPGTLVAIWIATWPQSEILSPPITVYFRDGIEVPQEIWLS